MHVVQLLTELYKALVFWIFLQRRHFKPIQVSNFNIASNITLRLYNGKFKGAFLYGPGPCEENLRKQVGLYKLFFLKKRPTRNMFLLELEHWYSMKSRWYQDSCGNSRSQQMIGIAMHAEDMASLLDVYSTYDDTEHKTDQTNYIMQFLWRDLSSSYDIVGPYILHFKWDRSRARVLFHVSWKQ